jgi:hypothetical protein
MLSNNKKKDYFRVQRLRINNLNALVRNFIILCLDTYEAFTRMLHKGQSNKDKVKNHIWNSFLGVDNNTLRNSKKNFF